MESMAVKSQSAMEYLMTYGWAILAIAIVMVSLYSLGIFNTGNLQPTATPGSCEVVRTAAQTSLAGQCNNLIPKYVGKFNGQNSYDNVSTFNAGGQRTYALWFNLQSIPPNDSYALFSKRVCVASEETALYLSSGGKLTFLGYNQGLSQIIIFSSTYTFTSSDLGKWFQVDISYDGSYARMYIDGKLDNAYGASGNIGYQPTCPFYIGAEPPSRFTNGSIANVQTYNTSLDSATISALYKEGIGGAPIDIQHLVGWWPLNGNANDYSGNNDQGTITNVIWDANWQSGYSSPTT